MTNIQDAIKYGWVNELAESFFYEKCNGKSEDIIKEIKKLIISTVEAQKVIEAENKILDNIPF